MDKVTKSYWAQRDRLKLQKGILWRYWWSNDKMHDFWQMIPPKSYRNEIIAMGHSNSMSSHVGLRKTLSKVQSKAYWVGWTKDTEEFIKSCDMCAKYLRGKPPKKAEMQIANVGEPFERVSMDITGPHPKSRSGNIYIVTVM